MQNTDWDIFRYIIAVADSGSAVAAAKKLGVNDTTVLRRISRFEQDRGIRLFDRRRTGFVPTPECDAIISTAREIQENVSIIDLSIAGQDLRLGGQVTVTTTDTFLEVALADIITEFCRGNPDINVEITLTNDRLSLTRRDADIAIRASKNPPEHLLGQRVSMVSFAVYGSMSRLSDVPETPTIKDLKNKRWIGPGTSIAGSPVQEWMDRNIPATSIAVTADTFPGMRSCVEHGGIAVLPCCLGDRSSNLKRLLPPIKEMETSLWVLTHPDVRKSARVKALSAHLSARLRDKRELLSGAIT